MQTKGDKMKTREFIINICDTNLLFYDTAKEETLSKDFKSLQEDEIINSELFKEEFNQLLRTNHIHIPLFGWNLVFIKRKKQNPIITEKYKEIFSDYFRKIKEVNIEDIIDFEKDTGYLNITNHYIDFYYLKKNKIKILRIYPEIFNDNYNKMINYILTNIYKPEKMIVFGTIEDVSKYAENINKNYGISVTFPEYPSHFIIKEYKI